METISKDLPKWGSLPMVAERAQMYQRYGFRDDVMGPNAARFLAEFCKNNKERARELGRQAQRECVGNEPALVRLAGRLKYLRAHLDLAEAFGKQIAIMSENESFREQALAFVSLAYAELEALEHFDVSVL